MDTDRLYNKDTKNNCNKECIATYRHLIDRNSNYNSLYSQCY